MSSIFRTDAADSRTVHRAPGRGDDDPCGHPSRPFSDALQILRVPWASYRGAVAWKGNRNDRSLPITVLLAVVIGLAACSTFTAPKQPQAQPAAVASSTSTASSSASRAAAGSSSAGAGSDGRAALPGPAALRRSPAREIRRRGSVAAGGTAVARPVAVYETMLDPAGGTTPAGIAWMDTRLLSARLYSGSRSPGGGPYKYTAPVTAGRGQRRWSAAFNGGFLMADAHGGYYTEGRVIDPLRRAPPRW